MFRRSKSKADAAEKICRCEATIAPAVLDGFACGRPDCWRTALVHASQERFAADLIRRRVGDGSGDA